MGPLSGWLSDRFGARYLASAGMGISAATFVALLFLSYDFPYWQMGWLLFVQGCGMGMFAAPNTAAIMNAVPPEHRGAASGMRATLQNAGMQISMAFFFTIVLVGLANGLPGSVSSALSSAGVPGTVGSALSSIVSSNPTGALFGAFLGKNPMGLYISSLPSSLQSLIPPTVITTLTSKQFFPNAVAPAFLKGIDLAFLISAVLTAIAAGVSLMRGERYVHELHSEAARRAPPTKGTSSVPPGQGEPSPEAESGLRDAASSR
jgi:MFS family permease